MREQSNKSPLLVLEMNEIPWRLVDHFLARPDFPHLKEFFSTARTFTTVADEPGELSPWITWPSLHRGLKGADHQVSFLGQDPQSFRGTPIWEEFRKQGESIGVCGSLQSWPPVDPGPGGFYIPDTFARDERCVPAKASAFQAFNLRLTGMNGRKVNRRLPLSKEIWRFAKAAPFLGFRLATAAAVAKQLLDEQWRPRYVARRPIFQATLLWDIFRGLYNPLAPPAYAAFFTNHVASAMHRYWGHLFPEDFSATGLGSSSGAGTSGEHRETIIFAMQKLEKMLGEALEFQRRNPALLLAFASSMGQAAVTWERFEGVSTIITDPRKLIRALCPELSEHQFAKGGLAMVPQVTIDLPDSSVHATVREALVTATCASGAPLFFPETKGEQLSLSIRTPSRADIDTGGFLLRGRPIRWTDAGIEVAAVDTPTAYHIPEGILAVRGRGITASAERTRLDLHAVKAYLLEISGRGVQITSQCKSAGMPVVASAPPVTASLTS